MDLRGLQLDDLQINSILLQNPPRSIHTLRLQDNQLSPKIIKKLVHRQSTQQIRSLSLQNNSITDLGIKYLCTYPALGEIKELHLERTSISPYGFQLLSQKKEFQPQILSIGFNKISPEIAIHIASLSSLEYLDMQHMDLEPETVSKILERTKAKVVKLGGNHIAFPKRGLSKSIKELFLEVNNPRPEHTLQQKQVQQLARLKAPGLQKLYLGKVFVSNEELLTLTRSPWFAQLDFLSLSAPQNDMTTRQTFLQRYGDHRWMYINKNDFSD